MDAISGLKKKSTCQHETISLAKVARFMGLQLLEKENGTKKGGDLEWETKVVIFLVDGQRWQELEIVLLQGEMVSRRRP